jgi:hypothetical protein
MANNGEMRTAYRMTTNDGSLCKQTPSEKARDTLGIEKIKGLTDPTPGNDLVIPVLSELYDRLGRPVAPQRSKWMDKRPEWLSLACVEDALAKRSLYDLYTDNVKNSRAALNMLMANYCNDRHVTTRGVEIGWELADDAAAPRAETISQRTSSQTMLEAKWDEHGAVCLSEPRLLYRAGPVAQIPTKLPPDLDKICPECKTPTKWADAVRKCAELDWARENLKDNALSLLSPYVAHAPLTDCESCPANTCKGRLFHTFVIPGHGDPKSP